MCLFNFKKRKKQKVTVKKRSDNNRSDRLEQDSALPFGWVVYNKNYVDMIDADVQPFRERIFEAKTVKEKRDALKSYIIFLEDGKKYYKKINPYVGRYFEEYICDSAESVSYIEELSHIEENFEQLIEREKWMEKRQQEINALKTDVLERLKEQDGVLQASFIKTFDESVRKDVSFILYSLDRENKVERIKSGRSYILHIKE